jgi:hypothetical protein
MFEIVDNPSPNEAAESTQLLAEVRPENLKSKFIEAASQNLPMVIRQLRTTNPTVLNDRAVRHDAVLQAMSNNAAYALREVFQYQALDLTDTGDKDQILLYTLMAQASSKKITSLQIILFAEGVKHFSSSADKVRANLTDQMKEIGASPEMISFVSGQYPAIEEILPRIVSETSSEDTDFFRMALSHMLLNNMKAEDIFLIIERNPRGFEAISGEIVQEFSKRGLPLGDLEEKYVEAAEKARYKKEDKYTLSDTQNLTGGIRLTTIFNFRTQQQIIIAEKKGTIMTMDVKSFDDILGQDSLSFARQKLEELGGQPDISGMGKKARASFTNLGGRK